MRASGECVDGRVFGARTATLVRCQHPLQAGAGVGTGLGMVGGLCG